jgi:small subunit ribosomal protein S17
MRTKKWVVTSDVMNKTIVVSIHTYKSHPKYNKRFRVTKKFYAHDEENKFKVWDTVLISETKPLSKTKRWMVVDEK